LHNSLFDILSFGILSFAHFFESPQTEGGRRIAIRSKLPTFSVSSSLTLLRLEPI